MDAPARQLDAIHAMLASGHRNLRVERHSLLLWGIPPGLLFAFSELILTPQQIPDLTQRALAWLALIAGGLALIGAADWHWTRKAKRVRDESWSFIHRQVMKAQWLFMGMATLATYASFFYGGGYMVCAVWLVFLGLSLFLHGLFSEELLEWAGALCIAIAVAGLVCGAPYETMRWVSAAVFGIGLPLLSAMLDRGRHRAPWIRLVQVLAWLSAVVVAPVWAESRVHRFEPPAAPSVSLADFTDGAAPAGETVVLLPRGTPVPVEFELGGDIFEAGGERPVLTLTLGREVELLLKDGQPTGDVRLSGQAWTDSRQVRWIRIPWLKADLTPQHGPRVTGSLVVQLRNQ